MYTDEIDIVNIINSIRQLRVALKVLLTENQLKILEFANYRNLDSKYDNKNSIVNSVLETDSKGRYNKLCHHLNLDDKRLDLLSINELNTLYEVLEIDSKNEALDISSCTDMNLLNNKVYPIKGSQLSLKEEHKSMDN